MQFPNANPIGNRVSVDGPDGPWREIVGVVRDSKYASLSEDAVPVAYLPLAQNHETGMVLYVRASVAPASLVASLRREIQQLDANLPVPNIRTMSRCHRHVAVRRAHGRVAARGLRGPGTRCWRS